MKTPLRWLCLFLFAVCPVFSQTFNPVGTYVLRSHCKIIGTQVIEMPMKPVTFLVTSDGTQVKISIEGDPETATTYQIYRSDGISRQRADGTAIEVVPGLQATCQAGGVLRHLRLSREFLTLTTFPGASDQTLVSHATARK